MRSPTQFLTLLAAARARRREQWRPPAELTTLRSPEVAREIARQLEERLGP